MDSGEVPIGTISTWSFPEFVNSPKVPNKDVQSDVQTAQRSAIPSFNDPEYARLVEIRAQIFENIAAEFPEIDQWIVGYEANYVFKDLKGNDLDLDSYASFALDSLESATDVIKKVNPKAVVIGHFIGRWEIPIMISGDMVQPIEVINKFNEAIIERGTKEEIYFDQFITDLVPSLADDRAEDLPGVMYGSKSAGWNTKWSETFSTATGDLAANYADWEDIRTTIYKEDVAVSSGDAHCILGDRVLGTVAGAKTDGVTVVPSAAEFDDNFSEKDYWTAVMDFDPIDKTDNDDSEHTGVFIRVNDRTWDSDPNQTRFGTIVYTNDTNVAYLQFEGNHDGDSTEGIQHFESFYLSEQPFDDGTTTTWRLQIHERKVLQIDYSYELQWKGEIWKSATRKGYSSWIEASTVEDSEVDIPELSGSGYLFGFVTNETSSDGEMDVAFDATAYWEYN